MEKNKKLRKYVRRIIKHTSCSNNYIKNKIDKDKCKNLEDTHD
jgi:hypothetical protein